MDTNRALARARKRTTQKLLLRKNEPQATQSEDVCVMGGWGSVGFPEGERVIRHSDRRRTGSDPEGSASRIQRDCDGPRVECITSGRRLTRVGQGR